MSTPEQSSTSPPQDEEPAAKGKFWNAARLSLCVTIALALITAVCAWVPAEMPPEQIGRDGKVGFKEMVKIALADPNGHWKDKQHEVIKWTFDHHLSDYEKRKDAPSNNLKLVLALSLLAFVALRNKGGTLKFPKLDVEIPVQLAFTVLGAGLIYLFYDFGLRMNGLIYSRMALERLHLALASYSGILDQSFYDVINSNSAQAYLHPSVTYLHPEINVTAVLQDRGPFDAWWMVYGGFLQGWGVNAGGMLLGRGTVCIMGIMLGISHGLMLRLIQRGFAMGGKLSRFRTGCAWAVFIAALAAIVGAHFGFHFAFQQDVPAFQTSMLLAMMSCLVLMMSTKDFTDWPRWSSL